MLKKILLFVLAVGFSVTASAQLVSLSGKVTTSSSAGISGATVNILNTGFTAITGSSGSFSINKVPAGTYEVQVSAFGYAAATRRVVLKNADAQPDFVLREQTLQLDEVVVTAQKREESLQSIPASISVLSAKKVQDYRIWNTRDLSALAPNLYSAGPGDNRNITAIRGISTTSYDQAVATYVDGVNQFGLDTYIAPLQDVERIEILRGPQGTLYGRNAMGGVINIITRQPGSKPGFFIEESFGNYGQQRLTGGLRVPVVKDKLFFGASGLYSGLGGFYTNSFNNSKFDKQHSTMGNYYLKWLESDQLTITLNVKHNANRNLGTFPLASSINDALENPFTLNQDAQTRLIDNIFNTSLSLNYSGSKVNFSSQTAYQYNNRYYKTPIDGDFSPIDGVTVVNNYGNDWNHVKVFTNEFRLSSPASSASDFKWTAGTFTFIQETPVKQGTHFGKDGGLLGAPFPNFTAININNGSASGAAFFGQFTYTLAPKLDLTAGMRYDYEHKRQAVRGEFQPDGTDAIITRPDTSGIADFHAVSPKVSLAYKFSDRHNLYGSYSRGFRAGGFSQLSSDPSQPPLYAYEPEYSNSFEVGFKNSLANHRLQLNLTAFYTAVRNAQVPTLVLPDAITVTRNAGKLNSKGVELELSAALGQGFNVDYNAGYTDATYKSLVVPSNGAAVNLDGTRQVFTPKMTSMLGAQYTRQLGKSVRMLLHGDWKYLTNQYFDLANQQEQPGYNLFNARAGAYVGVVEVFVWGSNLGDKTYVDYAYDFGAAHLGNPRTYGVSLGMKF
ncbi:TonB-dependent receptor [Hufsiella ginkgonis]|uniref:TonB-dependent receptor n=1 Tax=Hufsiella ginkgonis TaxID=2695274 RepID=A0A7K1XZ37_9SPHI|nr:TonB-dependent receptor [Hufsiella ginkgonis]MXV16087.1 TonB-dependent receptor [Hufsiella ginkgonis]